MISIIAQEQPVGPVLVVLARWLLKFHLLAALSLFEHLIRLLHYLHRLLMVRAGPVLIIHLASSSCFVAISHLLNKRLQSNVPMLQEKLHVFIRS